MDAAWPHQSAYTHKSVNPETGNIALLVSEITCATLYLNFPTQETAKIEALIRNVGGSQPQICTSKDKLLKQGLPNFLGELIKARRILHRQRLTLTPTGQTVLHALGYLIPPNKGLAPHTCPQAPHPCLPHTETYASHLQPRPPCHEKVRE